MHGTGLLPWPDHVVVQLVRGVPRQVGETVWHTAGRLLRHPGRLPSQDWDWFDPILPLLLHSDCGGYLHRHAVHGAFTRHIPSKLLIIWTACPAIVVEQYGTPAAAESGIGVVAGTTTAFITGKKDVVYGYERRCEFPVKSRHHVQK